MALDVTWLQRYRELKDEAARTNKAFKGPDDPHALLEELEKNEFKAETASEGVRWSTWIERLRKELEHREDP
jgi:hypothetical protein